MGTNTSKPLTYATTTHGSARMGGVQNFHSYPNGAARMGGVHPKRRKVKKNHVQSSHQRQTSEMDPEATLIGDSRRNTQQHLLHLSEAETIVNDHHSGPPPPPYSR